MCDGLVLRPGDSLVATVPVDTSPEQASRLQSELGDRLPGVEVLVLTANQVAVYRPENPAG